MYLNDGLNSIAVVFLTFILSIILSFSLAADIVYVLVTSSQCTQTHVLLYFSIFGCGSGAYDRLSLYLHWNVLLFPSHLRYIIDMNIKLFISDLLLIVKCRVN